MARAYAVITGRRAMTQEEIDNENQCLVEYLAAVLKNIATQPEVAKLFETPGKVAK